MYGLYDTEGILRFTCNDKAACIAYAKLFDLSSIEFSLMPLSENNEEEKNLFIYETVSSGNEQQLNPSRHIFP